MITIIGIFRKIRESTNPNKRRFQRHLCSAKKTDDIQLKLMALRYLAHQLEKVIKHDFKGNYELRGSRKYFQAQEVIESLKMTKYNNLPDVIWARDILKSYVRWKSTQDKKLLKPVSNNSVQKTNFIEIVNSRRSIRFWKTEEIPIKTIEEIIETGMKAPSSCNRQTWKFTVVINSHISSNDNGVSNPSLINKAPYILYISIDNRMYSEKFAQAIDVGLVAQNILLAMASKNISACPIYQCESYNQNKLRKILHLSSYEYVYLALPFGIPDEDATEPVRTSISEVLKIIEIDTKRLNVGRL